MKVVQASAPSNIALIKYMGKIEGQGNRPTNSSLSWTLENLRTFVQISQAPDATEDQWAPLKGDGLLAIELSENGKSRFLQHFQNLKTRFQIHGNFLIESANNFPSDCGLASSASSFAALTMASLEMFAQLGNEEALEMSVLDRADLSRQGSGSSCRSFFGPWALWFQEGVRPVEFPMRNLHHQVIVVESGAKLVSSSEAHKRVSSSLLFHGRPERAEMRLAELMEAFRESGESLPNWRKARQIIWDEFQDMHLLFETSEPSFSYMTPETRSVLKVLDARWHAAFDGPLVTMDAGANVHLLYREDQLELAQEIKTQMASQFKVLSSGAGGVQL